MILKFVWKVRGAKILTTILRRKKKGAVHLLSRHYFATCAGAAGCLLADEQNLEHNRKLRLAPVGPTDFWQRWQINQCREDCLFNKLS